MTKSALTLVTIAALGLAAACSSRTQPTGDRSRYAQMVEDLYRKDTVTVLLTDSGLGGLSVTAALDRMFGEYRSFRHVRLVFANALPERGYAYNRMETTEEKARVFSAALYGMKKAFHPDIILIACNTLSVVYPQTEFATRGGVPVMGIVEFGVDAMSAALENDTTSSVIILGTPTTIGGGAHADGLAARGVDRRRIVGEACETLESEIQADPHSDMVSGMIEMYADDALSRDTSGARGHLVVGLCCSHYGFSRDVFRNAFAAATDRPVVIVDPNISMGEFVLPAEQRGRFDTTVVDVQVVSRAELLEDERASIAAAVRPVSEATARAVENYTLDTTLFTY